MCATLPSFLPSLSLFNLTIPSHVFASMDLSNTTDVKLRIKTTTTIDLHPLTSHINTNVLSWHCSLHKVGLKTLIEIWPTTKGDGAVRRNFFKDIRSLRIFNNRGELVTSTAVNNRPVNDRTYTRIIPLVSALQELPLCLLSDVDESIFSSFLFHTNSFNRDRIHSGR